MKKPIASAEARTLRKPKPKDAARMPRLIASAALIAVPLVAVLGTILFGGKRWDIASVLAAFLCCVPFFLSFERRSPAARELVLIAVMTAFAAAGRAVFAVLPFFKPVTAVTVISAMYFGPQAGFMVGAMSAVISNIFFGQGAWTPFQMFAWGIIGFIAGLLNRRGFLERPVPLFVYGALAGALYSLIMDVWTVLSADGTFNLLRWLAALVSSLPVTAVYCVSNVVFLLLLSKPLGRKLSRLKTKYGVFTEERNT